VVPGLGGKIGDLALIASFSSGFAFDSSAFAARFSVPRQPTPFANCSFIPRIFFFAPPVAGGISRLLRGFAFPEFL